MTTDPAVSEDSRHTMNFDMRYMRQESASSKLKDDISCHVSAVSSLAGEQQSYTHLPYNIPVPEESPANGRSSGTLINDDVDGVVPTTDDRMATIMRRMLLTKSSSAMKTVGSSLARRALIIQSINRLAKHVPYCVLSKISRDSFNVTAEFGNELPTRTDFGRGESFMTQSYFKHFKTRRGALLFIDMSGFTQLSQALDVESLSKVRGQCKWHRNIVCSNV